LFVNQGVAYCKELARGLNPRASIILECLHKVEVSPKEGSNLFVPLLVQPREYAKSEEIAEFKDEVLYLPWHRKKNTQYRKFILVIIVVRI
jgi:hypothetical protein